MSNTQATGKRQKLKEFEKSREAAMKKATPATPPQDEQPEKPQPTKEVEAPAVETTQEPPKVDTETKQDTAIGDIDYRTHYRSSQKEIEQWKERYRTLQTKYDKEVPRYAQEVKQLKKKVEQLEKGEGSPSIMDRAKQSPFYKKISEEYDPETADSFAGMLADVVQDLRPPEEEVEDPVPEPTFTDGSYDEFVITLDGEVPGWDVRYNTNQDFIKWAQETEDPQSGLSQLDLLNRAANETFDANVAKRIFSAFDRQVKKPAVPSTDSLVEPAGGGSGKTQPEAPTFKAGELKEKQDLLRRGKISRKAFDEFQQDFVKAQNEGRISM